jgi:hypothetical protein
MIVGMLWLAIRKIKEYKEVMRNQESELPYSTPGESFFDGNLRNFFSRSEKPLRVITRKDNKNLGYPIASAILGGFATIFLIISLFLPPQLSWSTIIIDGPEMFYPLYLWIIGFLVLIAGSFTGLSELKEHAKKSLGRILGFTGFSLSVLTFLLTILHTFLYWK